MGRQRRDKAAGYGGRVDDKLRDLLSQIDDATQRLLRTVGQLSAKDIRRASLLPGWTRGHVLSHVARNADGLRNLLIWARTGTKTPMYPSAEARVAGIEAGAELSPAELTTDLADSAARFRDEALGLPDDAWQVQVQTLRDAPFPASEVLVRRLAEVELHHADLGAGYGPADWPAAFATMELGESLHALRLDRVNR
jgi:maleylpyruvate isomerase